MDYNSTTPFMRYSLNVEAAREDLKYHGVDLALSAKISMEIARLTSEYGDCPEVALACIAAGYNAKCMADQDSGYAYTSTDTESESYKRAQAFNVVRAISERHESEIYEVISSWRA